MTREGWKTRVERPARPDVEVRAAEVAVLDAPEAEIYLLGALLIGEREAYDKASAIIDDTMFGREPHRLVWRAVKRLYDAGSAVDVITLAEELTLAGVLEKVVVLEPDGTPAIGLFALAALCDAAPTAANIEHHARIIWDRAARRQLRAMLRQAIEELADPELTPAAAAIRVSEQLAVIEADGVGTDGVALVCARDIRPEAVRWAWQDRIALGALTLLVGVPGLGKTLLAVWVAARASRGELVGDMNAPGDVVIASAEDSLAHTLVPRLLAAHADIGRVHFVTVRRGGTEDGLVLPDDVTRLGARIREVSARLLIIDPVMAHLSTELDSHRDHSVRRALAPLHRLAEQTDCAVLPIAHLNKSPSADIFGRVGGSIGLTAAARSILLMTPDPDAESDSRARVLTHGKSNLGGLSPTLRLRVVVRPVAGADGKDILAAALEPGELAPHIRVADVLRPTEDDQPRSERATAAQWLQGALSDGPQPARDIQAAARKDGISPRTLRRAMGSAGVKTVKESWAGPWPWQLEPPEGKGKDGHQDGQGGHSKNVDTMPTFWPPSSEPNGEH